MGSENGCCRQASRQTLRKFIYGWMYVMYLLIVCIYCIYFMYLFVVCSCDVIALSVSNLIVKICSAMLLFCWKISVIFNTNGYF